MNRFTSRRSLFLGMTLWAINLTLGCGGGDGAAKTKTGADEKAIISLVGGISDKATELERLRESFTKDGAPRSADLKKYSTNMFAVTGPVNVSGSSATFTVTISPYADGTPVDKQWKATKEGNSWKLSETPLP